jgi:hypothetical protein
VSDFAKELLDQLHETPVFDLASLNPGLYTKSKTLKNIKLLRMQLYHMYEFIATCRLASELPTLTERGTYLATDVDMYSLRVIAH